MKWLGIDYGARRTGIAVTDPEGIMAFPRETILMRNEDAFMQRVVELAKSEKAEGIVIGLPLYFDGSDSATTERVRLMAVRLRERIALPIYFMEETLSSYEAAEQMRAAGRKKESVRGLLDQAAAVAILESFIAQPESRRMPAGEKTE